MEVLRAAAYAVQPWKNGGGTTRVIAADPADAGYSAALGWRVSLPRIDTDGPFSPLAGLDRQWLLLEGAGVVLDSDEFSKRIERALEPVAFSGDWAMRARLVDGPVIGLSVLTRRGRVGAIVRIVELDATTPLDAAPGETLLVLVASGAVKMATGGVNGSLERYDALRLEPREAASLTPAGWSRRATAIVLRLFSARDQ